MTKPFVIDEEFHALIPPLSPDELAQLEANIIADGCRDPLVIWKGVLLDGHNRYEICTRLGLPYKTVEVKLPDREAAADWIDANALGRRNLTRDQWELIVGRRYNRKKKTYGGDRKSSAQNEPLMQKTADVLAAEYGVSPATVKRAGKTADFLDEHPKEKAAVMGNRKRLRIVKQDVAKQTRKTKRKAAAKDSPKLDNRIIIGDFRDHADKVADGSLSLIFTDPPYDRKASAMLPDLAAFAETKLAEGGSIICYVGQTQLPAALDAFRSHLRYWWTIACVHSGRATVMREYGINAGWKAVLWFVKGTRDDNSIMVSDVMSGGKEKDHHEWQQAESEATYWIEKICPADGIVCDPFLGSGTMAVAAKKLGRQWIGFEINEDTASIAGARIRES